MSMPWAPVEIELVAGTLGGLSLLTGGSVRRNLTTATSGLKHNWITGLAAVGDEWLVGTYGAGVMRLGADGSVTATEATIPGLVVNPQPLSPTGGWCWPERWARV